MFYSLECREFCVEVRQGTFLLLAITFTVSGLNSGQCSSAYQEQPVSFGLELPLLRRDFCYLGFRTVGFSFADLVFNGLAFPSPCHFVIISKRIRDADTIK